MVDFADLTRVARADLERRGSAWSHPAPATGERPRRVDISASALIAAAPRPPREDDRRQ
jgi:hypothetical protein